MRGDELDKAVAKFVNQAGCKGLAAVLIREGESQEWGKNCPVGKYRFCGRRVLMKLVQSNDPQVMVRVGGGWMGIAEFIMQYGDFEHDVEGIVNIETAQDYQACIEKAASTASHGSGVLTRPVADWVERAMGSDDAPYPNKEPPHASSPISIPRGSSRGALLNSKSRPSRRSVHITANFKRNSSI